MVKWIGVWVMAAGVVLAAVVAGASVSSDAADAAKITSIRYDADARGIVIELNRKMPYQVIQVDDRELLLALKSADISKNLPRVDGDALLASISSDRLPGNILGLMIHTKKNVTHDVTEWNDTSGHVLVRLK